MTARDIYIARKEARASGLRDAAALVPTDCVYQGLPARESIEYAARACDDHADWARELTASEFNAQKMWAP